MENDAAQLLSFIEAELDPINYLHCFVVQDYLNLLEENTASFDAVLREQFKNETYSLSKLLLSDWAEQRTLDLEYEEFNKLKQERIEKYFVNFDFPGYTHFLEQCQQICVALVQDQEHKVSQLQFWVTYVLLALANRDTDLYARVLEHYLELGEPFSLDSYPLVKKLIEVCGAEKVYEILNQYHYPTKRKWLFDYYRCLPPGQITTERLEQLYILYQEAELLELPSGFDFLLEYRVIDEKVVVKVTRIILEKADKEPKHARVLSTLFYPRTKVNELVTDIFVNELDLLKRAYFAATKIDRHADYGEQTFVRILDLDTDFILEYIDHQYKREDWQALHDDPRDYSFLWMRNDYEELMTRVTEHIYKWEQDRLYNNFFIQKAERWSEIVEERQNLFLKGLVERRHNGSTFLKFLFRVIAKFPPERCRQFIAIFLNHNKRFDDFQSLRLEPHSWGWSGSAVPMLQGRIEYFESLLSMLDSVDLLTHKQYVEQRIEGLRREIESEKRNDFVRD